MLIRDGCSKGDYYHLSSNIYPLILLEILSKVVFSTCIEFLKIQDTTTDPKGQTLMEKRYANAFIAVYDKQLVDELNKLVGQYSHAIIARQGVPIPSENINLISLLLSADLADINALAGKLGRLEGIVLKINVLPKIKN